MEAHGQDQSLHTHTHTQRLHSSAPWCRPPHCVLSQTPPSSPWGESSEGFLSGRRSPGTVWCVGPRCRLMERSRHLKTNSCAPPTATPTWSPVSLGHHPAVVTCGLNKGVLEAWLFPHLSLTGSGSLSGSSGRSPPGSSSPPPPPSAAASARRRSPSAPSPCCGSSRPARPDAALHTHTRSALTDHMTTAAVRSLTCRQSPPTQDQLDAPEAVLLSDPARTHTHFTTVLNGELVLLLPSFPAAWNHLSC